MRTAIVFVVALVASAFCPAALAEDWISISKTSDSHPTELFLDMVSISVTKNIRIAQAKFVPLLPWPDGTQPLDGATSGTQRVSFNCISSRVKFGSVELHLPDGKLGWLDLMPTWRPADDELTKKMLKLVCNFKHPALTPH